MLELIFRWSSFVVDNTESSRQMFLNCSCFHHVSCHRNPNRVLPALGSKLSVHSFEQEILVSQLQHRAALLNKNLYIFASEAKLQMFLACSYILGKFEPRCSYKIVLIKKSV